MARPDPRRHAKFRAAWGTVLAAIAIVMVVVSLPGADPAKRRSVYPVRFPGGAGRALAERNCLTCHAAPLTTQQRKDSTGWEKSLRQMETWGVKLSPTERDTLLTYLRAKFAAARKEP